MLERVRTESPPPSEVRVGSVYKIEGAVHVIKRCYGEHPSVVTLGGVKTSSDEMRLTCTSTVHYKTRSNTAAYLTCSSN